MEEFLNEANDPEELRDRIKYAEPSRAVKPIYLFADSQPLFWSPDGVPFLRSACALIETHDPLAVYVGASNGDDPAFYSIFEAAMEQAGVEERRMIPIDMNPDDLDSVERADLILLSGGDVEQGWRAFEDNGLKRIIARRYNEGALLMGVSAGAVQIGLGGWSEKGKLIGTFRIIPHAIGAHEEEQGWAGVKEMVRHFGEHTRGYGIPAGGGMIYHPDHSIEPIRRPLYEFQIRKREVEQHILLPGDGPVPDPDGDGLRAEDGIRDGDGIRDEDGLREDDGLEPEGDVLVINGG